MEKMNQVGLNHPDRMQAVSELTEEEKPKPCNTIDIDRFQQAYTLLKSVDRRVPPEIAKKAIHLISGARLLEEITLAAAYIVKLRVTKVALVFPLPDISRFSMPKPFQGIQHYTWALIHGTPTQSARNILLEGFIRPANWAFNKNLSKSDVRTFGAFYLGREVSQTDSFAQKRGKGQQDVLFGALYRGAVAHISYKAGGNETAQLSVADRGIATTSEKHTIAHSKHIGLKFFALKWQNLPMTEADDRSSSEDLTYRGINRRTEEQQYASRDHRDSALL